MFGQQRNSYDPEEDIFMICSDGLTDPLDDRSLASIFTKTPFPDLADELVQQALDKLIDAQEGVAIVIAHRLTVRSPSSVSRRRQLRVPRQA